MPDLLADARWIFVEDSPFLPARGGGEREHLGMLVAAHRAGVLAAVVLPGPADLDLTPYTDELGDVPVILAPRRELPWLLLHPRDPYTVASRPVPADLLARLRREAPGATGVVVTSAKSRRIGQAVAEGLGLPTVLRMHNREGEYHHALAAGTSGPRGLALRWEARRIDRDEVDLGRAGWLRGIADISAADAAWRATTTTVPVAAVAPFAAGLSLGQADDEAGGGAASPVAGRDEAQVVFVGALDIATNVTALAWLLDSVWPAVRSGQPQARLVVVGRHPDSALQARLARTEGVRLEADVPEVGPYLHRSAVAVNPAVSGSGVNIKLVEYLQAGCAVVSTSLATRGLPLEPDVDLLVRDEPDGFAHAVSALLADPVAARRLGTTGREHLLALLDPDRLLRQVAALMVGRPG